MKRLCGWAGVVSLSFTLVLSGCSSDKNNAEPAETSSAQETVGALPSASASPSAEASQGPTATQAPEETGALDPASSDAEPTPDSAESASPSTPAEPSKQPEAGDAPVSSAEPAASEDPEKAALQKQIDAKYEKKFSALGTSCKAKVSSLSGEVKAYIQDAKAADEEVTVSTLSKKFLTKVSSAEAGCDKSFNEILAAAKKEYADAGLDPADASKWSAMYNKSKNEARQQALSQILAAWRAGSS